MRHYKTLIVIALCNAISPLALQIIAPALPAIRLDLNTELAQTQLLLSMFSLSLAISMLVYGPSADRFSKKRLLVSGMMLFSLGSILGYLSTTIEMLVVARMLQAAGAGAASTISRTIAADTFTGDQLNRAMSIMMMVVVIGPMLAPLLGGYMVDHTHWSDIMALLFALGLGLALMASVFLAEPEAAGVQASNHSGRWFGLNLVLANPGFQTNMAILIAVQIGVYAFISASPFLIIEVLGYSASQYGLVFLYLTAGYMAGNFFSGVMAKKMGGVRLISFALGAYAIGALMLIGCVVADQQNLASIAGPALLLAFANGITQPNCGAGALASIEGNKGVAASLSGFGQIMAGALGFQIMGFLEVTSAQPLSYVIGLCSLIGILFAFRLVTMTNTVKIPQG